MKIMITGATGFIGSNMLLGVNGDFTHTDKIYGTILNKDLAVGLGVPVYRTDLTDKYQVSELFRKIKPDIVIQCAATTSGAEDGKKTPWYHVTDNVIMNSILLKEAYLSKVKHFIFFSCSVMYNPALYEIGGLAKETDLLPIISKDYFGVGHTKVYLENMCKFYSELGDMKCTAIRHSNTYGPYDKYGSLKSHVLAATITKVLTQKNKIVVWGNGEEKRDFLHVDDLVRFVNCAIREQKTNYELVNVGGGVGVSIKDLVKLIIEKSGKKLEIEYDLSAPTMISQVPLNTKKAKDIFGWEQGINLSDGIVDTLKWVNNNLDLFKVGSY